MNPISPETWNKLMEDLFTIHREQMLNACKANALSLTQMVTLVHLARVGETRMGELAEVLGITQGAVTPVIDRLVERGWAERFSAQDDRRSVWVRLTPAGVAFVDDLYRLREKHFYQVSSLMQPEEVLALYQGMTSLLNAWRRIQP